MGGAFSSSSSNSKAKTAPPNAVNRQAEISDVDRAVLDLKNTRDRLTRYRNKLQADSDKLVEQARHAKLHGRKETALGLLRLRKYKTQQANGVDEQLLTVLQMVETIDSKQNEKQLLDALAIGKDALKRMHEETTVDDVLHLMDQIQEEIAVEQEITEILQGVPTLSPADELAVEQELAQMQEDMMSETGSKREEGTATSAVHELPAVPTTKLPDLPTRTTTTPTITSSTAATQQPERVAIPG